MLIQEAGTTNGPSIAVCHLHCSGSAALRPDVAGDADQDLDFDQLDLVKVQIAGRYLTGQAATWGDGDWNGAPGGAQGSPPAGDGLFDQLDIIAALNANVYLQGKYCQPDGFAALAPVRLFDEGTNDEQASIVYDANTGEVAVNAPASTNLTSVNVDSASGMFMNHDAADQLTGSFDNHSEDNIFKATFGDSFASLSFGAIATPGLSQEFVAGDLTVVGSLEGGGALGNVDLIYIPVPEPSTFLLASLALIALLANAHRSSNFPSARWPSCSESW